jgi:hypothetical protein
LSSNGGGGTGVNYRKKFQDFIKNTDEEATLEYLDTYGIALHKGTLVLKTSLDSSFSFKLIFMSPQQLNAETLRHEHGHTIQFQNKGLRQYLTDVAMPSITINMLDRMGKLPYDYFTYPWEAEANALGGSSLGQYGKPSLPEGGYNSYWDIFSLFFE